MVNRLAKLAQWRELEAQKRDVPRNRLLRDDTLIDLAGSNPKTAAEFSKIRGFPGGETGKLVKPLLNILQQGLVRIHNPERLTFYEDFQQNILKFCVGVLLIYLLNIQNFLCRRCAPF